MVIWRVVYIWKQIFLWLLFCFVIFTLCFQQNQTPVLVYHPLQNIPSHFMDFLHHTWRTKAQGSDPHPWHQHGHHAWHAPPASMCSSAPSASRYWVGNIAAWNLYRLRAIGKGYPAPRSKSWPDDWKTILLEVYKENNGLHSSHVPFFFFFLF